MDNKVTVYVPNSYLRNLELNELNGRPPRPSEFWTSKPDGWRSDDLAVLHIDLSTYTEWMKDNSQMGRQILKG